MSDPRTPEGRTELRQILLDACATDQSWNIWHDLDHQGFTTIGDEAGVLTEEKPYTEECNPFAHVYTPEIAALIVAAVNALPALLDALDQAQDYLKANQQIVDQCVSTLDHVRDLADAWDSYGFEQWAWSMPKHRVVGALRAAIEGDS